MTSESTNKSLDSNVENVVELNMSTVKILAKYLVTLKMQTPDCSKRNGGLLYFWKKHKELT